MSKMGDHRSKETRAGIQASRTMRTSVTSTVGRTDARKELGVSAKEQHPIERDGSMKKLFIVSIALVALVGSKVGVPVAESETLTGTASASGTYKRPGSFNVKDFGAKGDGVADDTSAVQSAINAATKSAGGGVVILRKGTYLLNSAYPSRHPWAFHNLLIESNVTLLGETGAKLLQGPKGRHALPEGAEGVRNSVLAFGADHETIRFQNPAFNGGFFSLQATQASSTKVALKTSSDSSKFLPGDYVAIYEITGGTSSRRKRARSPR